MKRTENVRKRDKLLCFCSRAVVLMVFACASISVYSAMVGSPRSFYTALVLLASGSAVAFLAQVFADGSGALSRFAAVNAFVYAYSRVWLPTVTLFALWSLAKGDFRQATSSTFVVVVFWLIGYSARLRKLQRAV